jgi:hypothetical protein
MLCSSCMFHAWQNPCYCNMLRSCAQACASQCCSPTATDSYITISWQQARAAAAPRGSLQGTTLTPYRFRVGDAEGGRARFCCRWSFHTLVANRATSGARSAGCSRAAKWPPLGNSLHWTTLYLAATQDLGGRKISLGKIATPVGVGVYTLSRRDISSLPEQHRQPPCKQTSQGHQVAPSLASTNIKHAPGLCIWCLCWAMTTPY